MTPVAHKPTPQQQVQSKRPVHKPRHTTTAKNSKHATHKQPAPKVGLAAVTLPGRHGPGHLRGGHQVLIQALTRPAQVTALLGAAGARLTGGYGKWEEVPVPRWEPLTQWTGRSLWTMDLDLLLDGWGHQRSVEGQIHNLELFALYQGKEPMHKPVNTPPPIRITGAVPHPELKWVVSGIDWGDALRDHQTGQRLRQAVTLHLMEYIEETAMITGLRGPAAPRGSRKYQVKKGDDLKKVAARLLGKSSKWPEIAKLNKGLRGWRLGSKWVGKTILVPR